MSIYQHFRQDEKPFIDAILDWKDSVTRTYRVKITDFLDPREQDIIKMVCGENSDVTIRFDGGYEAAERKRAVLLPPYSERNEEEFPLSFFQLNYPEKFADIAHPQLLGSLMGIGLVREKFGDLLFNDKTIQFIVASEVADFVRIHLTKVGPFNVTVEEISRSSLIQHDEEWEEGTGTVSSLRLDTVLAEVYHLSRANAIEAIKNGRVKVNWKMTDKPSEQVHPGDYFSFRGFGRSQFFQEEGVTKKGKQRIMYRRLKS